MSRYTRNTAIQADTTHMDLLGLPDEVLVQILERVDARSLGRLTATCTEIQRQVEEVLSQRTAAHRRSHYAPFPDHTGNLHVAQLPINFSAVSRLIWLECERIRNEAWVPIAAGATTSFIVADGGRLMSCGTQIAEELSIRQGVLGQGYLRIDQNVITTPTPLPSMVGVNVNQVSSRGYFTAAVSRTGSVYTWGTGEHGCLGHGHITDSCIPKQVHALTGHRVLHVAAGYNHCVAFTETGEVFTWGLDQHGQCGHGTYFHNTTTGRQNVQRIPRRVRALAGVHAHSASAGTSHSLVVADEGTLYSFGEGNHGRLGHGLNTDEHYPRAIDALQHLRITSAAAGCDHSLALAADGTVFAWGSNEFGQLGIGQPRLRMELLPHPIQQFQNQQQSIYSAKTVCSIVAGENHSFALTAGGHLWEWGQRKRDQALINHTPIRVEELRNQIIIAVATNDYHSIAVSSSGRVVGSGYKYYLGLNTDNADGAHQPHEDLTPSPWYTYSTACNVNPTSAEHRVPNTPWPYSSRSMYIWYYSIIGIAWTSALWYTTR